MHKYAIASLLLGNILILVYTHSIGVSHDVTALAGTDAVRDVLQAKRILDNDQIADIDSVRLGRNTENPSAALTLYPYLIAITYPLVKLANVEFESFIIFLPVLLFALTLIPAYPLIRRIFDQHVALLSINFMVLTPPLLASTYAGVTGRGALVLFLSICSLFFYLQSYAKRKKWFYQLLSSCAMLCLGLTWEGVGLFASIVVTVELIKIMVIESYDGGYAGRFALWTLPILAGLLFFKPDVYLHLSQPYAFLAIVYPLLVLLIAFLVPVIQHIPLLKKSLSISHRFPVGFGLVVLLGIPCILFTSNHLVHAWLPGLIKPFGYMASFEMISELQELDEVGWIGWPGTFFIPMVFGLVLIVNTICDNMRLHRYWTLAFILVMAFGIAFSQLSSGQPTLKSTENSFALTIYLTSIAIGITGLLVGFMHARRKHNTNPFPPIDNATWSKMLLVVWSLGTLVAFRGALQLAYLFAIPGTILGSYVLLWPLKGWIEQTKQRWLYALYALFISWQVYALFVDSTQNRLIFTSIYVLLACITLLVVFCIGRTLTQRTLGRQLGLISLVVYIIVLTALSPQPALGGYAFRNKDGLKRLSLAEDAGIQNTLTWIGNNTEVDARVAASWEYGPWLNLLSNRSTIVDERQREDLPPLIGKQVFMANDVQQALKFLRSHQADYLFLTRRNIESMETFAKQAGITQEAGIPIFGNVVQGVNLDLNSGVYKYYRYWMPKWGPVVGEYDLHLGTKTYPAGTWSVSSIYIQMEECGEKPSPVKAMMELELDGTYRYLPPQSIHYGDKILYANAQSTALPCTILICCAGRADVTKWHVVYLSPQVCSFLAIRLFLLDELGEHFERVYPTSDNIEDYTAQVWKIKYPDDIDTKPEYLRLDR